MPTTTQRRRLRDEEGRFQGDDQRRPQEDYEPGRVRRGFGSPEPEERRELASGDGHSDPEGDRSGGCQEVYEQPRSRRLEDEAEEYYEAISPGRSRRGFAAMDPERQREIASRGGRAPHSTPRGFAAMDEEDQREIASEGGRAPHRGPRGFAAMNPEWQREIASRGGRAPHSGPRGFAAMGREDQREIAARGGHASRG